MWLVVTQSNIFEFLSLVYATSSNNKRDRATVLRAMSPFTKWFVEMVFEIVPINMSTNLQSGKASKETISLLFFVEIKFSVTQTILRDINICMKFAHMKDFPIFTIKR